MCLPGREAALRPSFTGAASAPGRPQLLPARGGEVALDRDPVSQVLGYEEQGVAMDRGHVPVHEYMRTNVPTIPAVSDLVPTFQLTHVGFADAT
jgi:hypothetical protein